VKTPGGATGAAEKGSFGDGDINDLAAEEDGKSESSQTWALRDAAYLFGDD
jgi:hypothetical protein